ncbi:MAG: aminoacetone oxidase family FAD-binding enzyme [Bacteroidetes bacterium]|nr:MAG: aminoacetone oxidase family FAD-binding enzyme [Bacteroidota bacterium]
MGYKVAIIGGGAAGFFTAINIAERTENVEITIYEASNKLLVKVLVSGGGRCNLTNTISEPTELIKNYPRGNDFLRPVFEKFSSNDTQDWFTSRGVALKTEEDGRVFPASNSSQSIYDCLVMAAKENGVKVTKNTRLLDFSKSGSKWKLTFKETQEEADFLVLATGSSPSIYKLLVAQKIDIIPPIPSLFTFNAKQHHQVSLAGVSVPNATTRIRQINTSKDFGPLLITHWGYSAPSILKLSAWYARDLSRMDYTFNLLINWNSYEIAELRKTFASFVTERPKDKVYSWRDHGLPKRLWQSLFSEANFREFTNWSEIGKKGIERLLTVLCAYDAPIKGKSTFKEEFVTAGGISLDKISVETFELDGFTNLYAAGEVLNIDAITGGFNFQAAWSAGYSISMAIASRINE